jgi:hypothetical protein
MARSPRVQLAVKRVHDTVCKTRSGIRQNSGPGVVQRVGILANSATELSSPVDLFAMHVVQPLALRSVRNGILFKTQFPRNPIQGSSQLLSSPFGRAAKFGSYLEPGAARAAQLRQRSLRAG